MDGILSLLLLFLFILYGYRFLSWTFTDRCEILHGGSAVSQRGLLLFWGIAPGMDEFWASTEAIWWDMLLAEALVLFLVTCTAFLCSKCARCILSIEFHQLSDQDAFKLAFRAALECIPSRLNGLAVSQRFIALSTLTYHQWSHPTLMALMKGELVEEQTGTHLLCIACILAE